MYRNLNITDSKTTGSWDGYKNWSFNFDWKSFGPECSASDCEQQFYSLLPKCTLYSRYDDQVLKTCTGAYNSHTMTSSGKGVGNCAAISYAVNSPEKPPVKSSSPNLPPPTTKQDNKCEIGIYEVKTCPGKLEAYGELYDGTGTFDHILAAVQAKESVSIDDSKPWNLKVDDLPHTLVITGELVGDYVQFAYSNVSWRSTDPVCNVGQWVDTAVNTVGNKPTVRDWDCSRRGGNGFDNSYIVPQVVSIL